MAAPVASPSSPSVRFTAFDVPAIMNTIQSTNGRIPSAGPTSRRKETFASAGVSYTGLIPGRDKDTAAFALYYGAFSQDLPGQTYEVALEWTYAIAVAPGLTVQPDIQYIMRPSGRSSIGNALVVGAQLSIQF